MGRLVERIEVGRPGLHKNLLQPPVALNDLRSQGAKEEGEGEGGEWRGELLERNQARYIQVRRLVLCTGADGMLWCCWAELVLVLLLVLVLWTGAGALYWCWCPVLVHYDFLMSPESSCFAAA